MSIEGLPGNPDTGEADWLTELEDQVVIPPVTEVELDEVRLALGLTPGETSQDRLEKLARCYEEKRSRLAD